MSDIAISDSIKEKIAWARETYERSGRFLLHENEIARPLSDLVRATERSKAAMETAGLRELCRICDEEEGGSCCGIGLENRYDGYLLFINMCIGVDLPEKRSEPESCLFLVPGGCRLKTRHVICINYICKKISDKIDSKKINFLRQVEGEEIDILFHLNERIKKALKELDGRTVNEIPGGYEKP